MNSPSPLTQRFIAHFGEMGGRCGINRTVGRIYALLHVQGRPLYADEIAEYRSFSRSKVSMGLKELQSWRLVELLRQPGDRCQYFEPLKNIWDRFKALPASLMKLGSGVQELPDVRDRFRFEAPDCENRDSETHHDDHPTSE